jgi:ubiquinone/menaquinone biosynthesis C-methylase UbiE
MERVDGTMVKHESYQFSVNDVSAVYAGPGGKLWELLMGEQIHVGGAEQTDVLARKVGLDSRKNMAILDICSALGGPARHLAEHYGAEVVGLDITPEMIAEARRRTEGKPYSHNIEYRLGSALDIPAHDGSFDVVWGQDAWCYIRDKKRLVEEVCRVLKPGGTLAFTDWIWGMNPVSKPESDTLMKFMVFPNMETFDGYTKLIAGAGFKIIEKEYLGKGFATHVDAYVKKLQAAKQAVTSGFGADAYKEAEKGLLAWLKAAKEDKVDIGTWIAKKT